MALVYKGVELGRLGRYDEAVAVFDQVLERFGDAAEPKLRRQVATAIDFREEALRGN